MSENAKTTKLVPVEKRDYLKKILDKLETWRKIIITNEEQLQNAVNERNLIKKMIKTAEGDRTLLVEPYKGPSDEVYGYYRPKLKQAENGLVTLNKGISDFQLKMQKEIDEKNKNLALAAEAERRKAEERAKKEEEKATMYREKGRNDMAEKAELRKENIIENATTLVPNVVTQKKVEGASFQTVYKLKVFSRSDVIKSLVSQGLFDFITFDEVKLNKKRKNEPDFSLSGAVFAKKIITSTRSC